MSDNKTEDVITKEFDIVTPPAVTEEEEDVKIYEPKEKEDSADDRHTRILDFEQHKASSQEEDADAMEGQLMFEGMQDETEEEPPEKSVEERLQDARRDKVENFRLMCRLYGMKTMIL